MRLAVIPARGGSKRIPRKNIKLFCGKPMIAWSIEAALQSGCFDRIIVSTDDSEIAEVARQYGAETPFVRPSDLADDHMGTVPVVAHAIAWQIQQNPTPSEVCCIYATAPFLKAEDLRNGLELMQKSGVAFACAVTTYAFPIQRAIRITADNRLVMFHPEHANTRSQDLETAWHDAGQFYWGQVNAWLTGRTIFNSDTAPIVLPRHRVQDIDTPEDWRRAELLFAILLQSTNESTP